MHSRTKFRENMKITIVSMYYELCTFLGLFKTLFQKRRCENSSTDGGHPKAVCISASDGGGERNSGG